MICMISGVIIHVFFPHKMPLDWDRTVWYRRFPHFHHGHTHMYMYMYHYSRRQSLFVFVSGYFLFMRLFCNLFVDHCGGLFRGYFQSVGYIFQMALSYSSWRNVPAHTTEGSGERRWHFHDLTTQKIQLAVAKTACECLVGKAKFELSANILSWCFGSKVSAHVKMANACSH